MKNQMFEINNEIAELNHSIKSLNAVYNAFSYEFAEGTTESKLFAIRANPEEYEYLLYVISNLIHDVYKKAEAIEALSDTMTA